MTLGKRMYWILALVAVMALAGAAITVTSRITSASGPSPTATAQTSDAQSEADDAAEATTNGVDTDTVEEQSGPQDEANDANGADAADIQEPQLNGSIAVPDAQYEGMSEADESAALAPLATITPEQASAAAQADVPGDVQKVELDNENGSLVYSVEIGGKDVKVDAGNGAVLHVESGGPED
jgi:uncharacterized membrane protein YkoI